MANTGEPLINVVTENKPKVLGCFTETAEPRKGSQAWAKRARPWSFGPGRRGSGVGAPNSPIADGESPAERRSLTHAGACAERGKPKGLPQARGKASRKGRRWACG